MKLSRLLIIFIIGFTLTPAYFSKSYAVTGSPLETTQNCFRQVLCMEETRYSYYKDVILALSYPKMRALRAFCSLPYFTADQAIETLERLVFYPLSFDQVKILEFFAASESASPGDCWQLLEKTSALEFTAMQAASTIGNITRLTAENIFFIIQTLKELDDSGRWAAKALFNIKAINAQDVITGINIIVSMNPRQRWTAEECCLLANQTPSRAIEMLQFTSSSGDADAANISGLFSLEGLTAENGIFWLHSYFAHSEQKEAHLFEELSEQQKSTLLSAFSAASDFLIWKINNLHAVTNDFGTEISTASLARKNSHEINRLFDRLHPKARAQYNSRFQEALQNGKRYDAAGHLKNATALARKLTAQNLTSQNIYILLSNGSELYDSSFRDILVPVLLKRIRKNFTGNLLKFLVKTDPENGYVSDFIISCAQKGKLTTFFPENPAEQRKILDLVTKSAFKNEQNLILFSATFNTLLVKIKPEVRTYLLDKMIRTIKQPDSTFALQLRVILQYYMEKHPDLLSQTDTRMITECIDVYGAIDLAPYTSTDFQRWKQDKNLSSLSIFQLDDDGSISYRSNIRTLIGHGYSPRLSTRLSLLPADSPISKKAKKLIKAEKKKPGSQIRTLYSLSAKAPIIIEWYKKINGIELSHAVAVYQSRSSQQRLLKRFLEKKIEMFAQRGHSYWRREQLLEPMKKLLEKKEINKDTLQGLNRFMSIGSCGGIRAYTELNKLFNNSIDILATVGTGKAVVNDPYNLMLFEIVATSPDTIGWDDVARKSASIFAEGRGSDYLQPGSLPAILHKMMDTRYID